MLWTVSNGFFRRSLFGGKKNPEAYLRRQRGGWSVLAPDGKALARISEGDPEKLTVSGTAEKGEAKIQLSPTAPALLPPRAEKLVLREGGETISLIQSEKRDFTVFQRDEPIGNISGILRHKAQMELPDSFPAEKAGVIYALALRMLQEDDVSAV